MPSSCDAGARASGTRDDLIAAQEVEPFLKQNLKVICRATLHEHVPVRTCRLDGFRLGTIAVAQKGFGTAPAFPDERNFSFKGEWHRRYVTIGTVVRNWLPWCEFDVVICLVACCSEP